VRACKRAREYTFLHFKPAAGESHESAGRAEMNPSAVSPFPYPLFRSFKRDRHFLRLVDPTFTPIRMPALNRPGQ